MPSFSYVIVLKLKGWRLLVMIDLMNKLRKYGVRWGLSSFAQIEYKSVTVNRLFTCVSAEHGACVLKIGYNTKHMENEYHVFHDYRGTRFCQVYEVDLAQGVLLLERIIPGIQLRDEPDLDQRLELFYDVFDGLHVKPADKTIYPTYMGWVSRITKYMRGRNDYEILTSKMIQAEHICCELWRKYPDEFLLHGDLHHDNILLDEDNCSRIIDPKGVIGDRAFDIPRFIVNEFGDTFDYDFDVKFRHIVRFFSDKLDVPEQDILRLVYVEICMGECWHVEDGREVKMDHVDFVEKMISDKSKSLETTSLSEISVKI